MSEEPRDPSAHTEVHRVADPDATRVAGYLGQKGEVGRAGTCFGHSCHIIEDTPFRPQDRDELLEHQGLRSATLFDEREGRRQADVGAHAGVLLER